MKVPIDFKTEKATIFLSPMLFVQRFISQAIFIACTLTFLFSSEMHAADDITETPSTAKSETTMTAPPVSSKDLKPKAVKESLNTTGDWRYTLRPSDSIWTVANDYLKSNKNWVELVRYNHITDPNRVSPGTTLQIPFNWLKVQPAPAIAISVTGEALVKKSQATQWQQLLAQQYLRVGDTIRTVNGSVLVKFADNSVLRLDYHTTLVFNRLSQFGKSGMTDTGLRLEKGRVSTKVKPVKENGSRYEISTPSAVAAVRGTEFRLETDGKQTNLEVMEGTVNLASPSQTLDVPAGFAIGTTNVGTLSTATPLPAPPTVKSTLQQINKLPATIAWNAITGAVKYQYSLFEGQQYDGNLLVRETTNTPYVTLNHLNNGDYTLTMRAISRSGIQGLDDIQKIHVNIRAMSAALISPIDYEHFTEIQPVFRWKPMDSNVQARLQVAVNEDFSELVIDSGYIYQDSRSLDIILKPNRYFWRVVTQAGGESIATSETRRFNISGELEQPKVISINYNGDSAKVFWKTIPAAESYTVQLSASEGFEPMLQEQTTSETSVAIRVSPGNKYYLRIRANGSSYYSPSISEVTELEVTY